MSLSIVAAFPSSYSFERIELFRTKNSQSKITSLSTSVEPLINFTVFVKKTLRFDNSYQNKVSKIFFLELLLLLQNETRHRCCRLNLGASRQLINAGQLFINGIDERIIQRVLSFSLAYCLLLSQPLPHNHYL